MKFYGLENLDELIARHVTAPTGTFVELGAYDGVTQNNTLHFEEKGWRGVLIEPVPAAFAQCVRNRPLAKVVNCACGPAGGPAEVEMTAVGLMSVVHGVSFNQLTEEDWVSRGETVQGLKRAQVRVPVRTLDSVLEEAGVTSIDLLVLDVEGSEIAVLQGFTLERFRPRYIVAEDAHSRIVADYLEPRGYPVEAILLERRFTRDLLYRRAES